MKYDLVLFDLDGTLINTLEAIGKTVNSCLEEMGLKTYSLKKFNELIGHGVAGIVEKIFLLEGYDEDTVNPDEVIKNIRKYYEKYYNYNVNIYKGIDRLLDFLEENSIGKGIVTNKDHRLAVKTVEKNLSKWKFEDIIGADDANYPRKPHPYGIEKMMKQTGVNRERVLYIGDMETDVKTAENAGVDIIYCNWGFGNVKGEKDIPEEIRVDNVEEVISIIKGNNK